MFKKLFIAVAALVCLNVTPVSSQETPEIRQETAGQYEETGNWVDSKEVDYVMESETARKMAQAKKAENAKRLDSFGGGITIIAMCIVISALAILSILFFLFGKISSLFLQRKKKEAMSVIVKGNKNVDEEKHEVDSGEVIAAISAALAQHFNIDHDIEDTILTIQRMRKNYSPWNSKIYNMRHLPEVEHTHVKMGKR